MTEFTLSSCSSRSCRLVQQSSTRLQLDSLQVVNPPARTSLLTTTPGLGSAFDAGPHSTLEHRTILPAPLSLSSEQQQPLHLQQKMPLFPSVVHLSLSFTFTFTFLLLLPLSTASPLPPSPLPQQSHLLTFNPLPTRYLLQLDKRNNAQVPSDATGLTKPAATPTPTTSAPVGSNSAMAQSASPSEASTTSSTAYDNPMYNNFFVSLFLGWFELKARPGMGFPLAMKPSS